MVRVTSWLIGGTDLNETSIMANIRYLPSRGTTREVGGIISTTSRKNTYKLVRMDIERVTWVQKITSVLINKIFNPPSLHCQRASRR